MGYNAQARKWLMVINNPAEAGLDHAAITEIVLKFHPTYFCMADEIATTGTFHTHIFFCTRSPVRFSTIKKRFPTAHIERAYGTPRENKEYISKTGVWADTDKVETSVPGTFAEWGELPADSEDKAPEMFQLMQELRSGKSTMEVLEEHPNLAFRIRDIELLRQTILAEKYSAENRKLEVTYLYGASGVGKTWGIFEQHDPWEICRITNYRGARGISFDGYNGQDVLVLRSSTARCLLRICSTTWIFTLCTSRPGTMTGWPVIQRSILLPICRWKSSTGRNSGTGRRPGGRSSAVSIM